MVANPFLMDDEEYSQYKTGNQADNPFGDLIPAEDDGSIWSDIPHSIARGLDITGQSIGGFMEMAHIPGGEWVKGLYSKRAERPEIQRPEYLREGTVVSHPERLVDPRWWVNMAGEQAPMMATMMAPGAALYRGSKALGLATKTATKFATAGAGAGAFVAESGSAYNDAKEEMLKMGYSEEDANRIATIEGSVVGTVNALLEVAPFNILLKNPGGKKLLSRMVRQGLWEGGTEAVQENVNMVAAELGHNPDRSFDEWLGRTIESGLGGFVMGGGVGVYEGGGQANKGMPIDVLRDSKSLETDTLDIEKAIRAKENEVGRTLTEEEVNNIVNETRTPSMSQKIKDQYNKGGISLDELQQIRKDPNISPVIANTIDSIIEYEYRKTQPVDILKETPIETGLNIAGIPELSGKSAEESAQILGPSDEYNQQIEQEYRQSPKGQELLRRDLAMQDPYLQDIAVRLITGENLDLRDLDQNDLRQLAYIVGPDMINAERQGELVPVPVREERGLVTTPPPTMGDIMQPVGLLPEGQRMLPAPEPGLIEPPPSTVGPEGPGQFAPTRRGPISQETGPTIEMGVLSKGDNPSDYTGKELRKIAKDNGLQIPKGMLKKTDMINFIKEKINDQEMQRRVQSSKQGREEPGRAVSEQEAGRGEIETGGILQTQEEIEIPEMNSTGDAIDFSKIATPEQLEEVKNRREELDKERIDLQDQAKEEPDKDKKIELLNKAMEVSTQAQFMREVLESKAEPKRFGKQIPIEEEKAVHPAEVATEAVIETDHPIYGKQVLPILEEYKDQYITKTDTGKIAIVSKDGRTVIFPGLDDSSGQKWVESANTIEVAKKTIDWNEDVKTERDKLKKKPSPEEVKGQEPATEKQFNKKGYWKSVLTDQKSIDNIIENGWKSGIGPNVTPLESSTAVGSKYAPNEGEVYMIIPFKDLKQGGNGPRVPDGYKPKQWQFIKHSNNKTPYQSYLDNFTETKKAAEEGKAVSQGKKRQLTPDNSPDFRSWVRLTGGINANNPDYGTVFKEMAFTVNPETGRKQLGRGWGYIWNNSAPGTDERVLQAIDHGWLPEGSTEEDFIELLRENPSRKDKVEIVGKGEIDVDLQAEEEYYRNKAEDLLNEEYTEEDINRAEQAVRSLIEKEAEQYSLAPEELTELFKPAEIVNPDKLTLTPTEPTKEEQLALMKKRGQVKSVQKKSKAVIPTEAIKLPTHGKQESLLGQQKGETGDLFAKKPEAVEGEGEKDTFTEGVDRIAESDVQYVYVPDDKKQTSIDFKPIREKTGRISSVRTGMATTGYIKSAGNIVSGPKDVASLLASIRKSAQEKIYTVTVDKDGVILEIHQYGKGGKAGAVANVSEFGGRVLNIKDAQKSYLVHNHPSGDVMPSPEDNTLFERFKNALNSKDIESEMMVIGKDSYSIGKGGIVEGKIEPQLRKVKLPIKERRIISSDKDLVPVRSPESAIKILKDKYKNQDGVMFLDRKNYDIAFLPFIKGRSMKETTADIIKMAESSNASAIIVNDNIDSQNRKDYIFSLTPNLLDVAIIDVVVKGESYANEGKLKNKYTVEPEGKRFNTLLSEKKLALSETQKLNPVKITQKVIKDAFPNSTVKEQGEGFYVKLPNGSRIWVVANNGLITPDPQAVRQEYGRKVKTGEKALAAWQKLGPDGMMWLSGYTDSRGIDQLVRHEVFHAAEDMVLTEAQLRGIRKDYKTSAAAADAYAAWDGKLKGKKSDSIFMKIRRFFRKIANALFPNAFDPDSGQAFADIRSGKIWGQTIKEEQAETKYALPEGDKEDFEKASFDELVKPPEFTKESKLAKRTEADAIEKKLSEDFGDLVEYKTKEGFMKDQAAQAETLLNSDYEKAKRIAMGEEKPSGDLRVASVYEAVKLRALNEGDTDLLYELGTESSVPTQLSEYGQEIKSADSSIMEDPVKAMQDIEKDRKGKNKRQGKKVVSIEKVRELKKKLADAEKKLKKYEGKTESENVESNIDKLIDKSPKRLYKKTNSKILKEKITDSVNSGKEYSEISTDIQELAKYFITQGVTERNALVKEVHNVIKDAFPGITLRETMDAISGYGKFKPLSKDEVLTKLRDLKGQMQQVAKLEDMQAGRAPLKTGIERRTPTDEERRLIKQVEEMKKDLGIETVDPEKQLKSALDSVKTRLSNQIKDLEYQIESGQKIVKKKTGLKYDVEAKRLQARRDDLKKQYDELFGKPEMSEDQRIQVAIKAVNKSIEEYTRRINENDLTPKPKRTPAQSEELTRLREQRDSLKAKVKELKDLAKPKKSPQEIALQRLKTRLNNEIKNFNDKLEKLDLEKKPRGETILDAEGRKLKAERDSIKDAYNSAVNASGVVTREEADRLIELSKEMADARQEMESGGDRFKYGAAKVAFLRYIDFLKGSERTIKTMLKDEWEEVRTTWKENKAKAFTKSAKDIISTISDLSISLMASLDNSFIGRQGLNTLLTHPTVWGPAAKKSFVDIYKTMINKHGGRMVRDAAMADAYSRPNYINGDYDIAKLIPKSEEQFPTSIPERIPGLGRAFKASENAFLNSGVRMRINTYDMLKKIADMQGVNTNDKEWIKDTGKLINSLTARGDLGKMGSGGPLRLIFWAPKMLWGNINVLTGHFGGASLNTPFARQQARKNLVKIVGLTVLAAAIIDALGKMFGKDDVMEWDPRSSDFMKIKINNTRYDMTAGKASLITLLARAATFKTKSTKTRKVTNLNSGRYGSKTLFDVIIDFMANKSAPVTKTAIDIARGRNFNYEKPTVGNTAYNLATPIGIQNFVESYQRGNKEIPTEEVIGNFLDMIGVNANTYDTQAEMRKKYRELKRNSNK